ncbi:MAG: hypothetical protein RIQ48_734 [Pseudomonadota bacterium]|jgi:hypothetical protein
MKEINFIITCFDKEAYWPYLKEIINSYKNIKSNIILCYNGANQNFKKEANIFIENTGHQHGEASLILKGFEYAQQNFKSPLFIKLSIDSWLLNENIILDIFKYMDTNHICYAGNYWNTLQQLSVDIFFINKNNGNFLESFKEQAHNIENLKNGSSALENILFDSISSKQYKFTIIKDRDPIHPNNRFCCPQLGWTMSHELQENLNFMKFYENIN